MKTKDKPCDNKDKDKKIRSVISFVNTREKKGIPQKQEAIDE